MGGSGNKTRLSSKDVGTNVGGRLSNSKAANQDGMYMIVNGKPMASPFNPISDLQYTDMVQFEHTKSTHTTVHEEVVHGPSVSGVGMNAVNTNIA